MKDKGGHKKLDVKMPGRTLQPLFHSSPPRHPQFPWDRPLVLPVRGMRWALGTLLLLASHSTGASGIFILGYSASLLEKWNCGGFPIRENNYVQVEGTALGSEGIFRLLRPQN